MKTRIYAAPAVKGLRVNHYVTLPITMASWSDTGHIESQPGQNTNGCVSPIIQLTVATCNVPQGKTADSLYPQ